jgi:DNA-binding GntR family transcriptional regulator
MIKRRSDEIAESLEVMILDGTFASGDRLDEAGLARKFAVSRTPIREAFQRLTVSGLAEQQPRRGVFVRQPGPVELVEMFEVMAELEAACGRLAARRIDDAGLTLLDAIHQRCQAAAQARDTDGYYGENEQFHQTIYAQSGNAFLQQETLRLQRRLQPFRRMQLRHRGRMEQSMAEHTAILEALRAGDGEGAAAALRLHVTVQGDRFHRLIASLREDAA